MLPTRKRRRHDSLSSIIIEKKPLFLGGTSYILYSTTRFTHHFSQQANTHIFSFSHNTQ